MPLTLLGFTEVTRKNLDGTVTAASRGAARSAELPAAGAGAGVLDVLSRLSAELLAGR